MTSDAQSGPIDPVEPDEHPEVPTPDTGREVPLPNRHAGQSSERPGEHDDSGRATPPPPSGEVDEDPDNVTTPTPVADPGPEDPSVS
ncbi:hypothetical protein [Patulibacter sp.]|uniref:hypothetical protein n=1 Tax=Patulibacter sp. TaxID=1912859 RepID=UPI00271F8F9C|nr:hypothetical protein [Patulibacter sp.]MDO9409425.1 hypothetical protein [Patulibacter sp.]